MALKIYDKFKPQGDYPAVDATDVEMPDGKRLPEAVVELVAEMEDGTTVTLRLYGSEVTEDEA